MIDWDLYEDNLDMLTDDLIRDLQRGDKDARWKLVLIFKSEILRAANRIAKVLHDELGRPNNGPEVEWLEKIESSLVRCYSTNFKLNYWNDGRGSKDWGGLGDE